MDNWMLRVAVNDTEGLVIYNHVNIPKSKNLDESHNN